MNYYYSDRYEGHWIDIVKMIEENYAQEYDDDTCLVLSENLLIDLNHNIQSIPHHNKKIAYQLEPLIENHWWDFSEMIDCLRKYDEVWDYDLDNIKILNQYGIDAKFRPFLYCNDIKRIRNKKKLDIDILFYGTPTHYRHKVLYNFIRLNLEYTKNIICANNVVGEMLDEFISRSKIILDLSTVDSSLDKIQKQTRIYYALINDKCVISQKSKRNYYGDLIVEVNNEEELFSTVRDYLNYEKWKDYSNISEKFKKLTSYDMLSNGSYIQLDIKKSEIIILYHIQQVGDWEKLYQEQINSLIVSGLYDECKNIFIGINGNEELPFILDKMVYFYNENQKTTANTLEYVWKFCNDNPEGNYNILYMHTMGVNHIKSPESHYLEKNAWRIYLEYFVIHKWKTCVADLNEHDCVGVEWKEMSGLVDCDTGEYTEEINPHYSGEFWWTKSDYVRKLDPDYLYNDEHCWARFRSEFWIGTQNPNYKSYHSSQSNLYNIVYSPNYYIN